MFFGTNNLFFFFAPIPTLVRASTQKKNTFIQLNLHDNSGKTVAPTLSLVVVVVIAYCGFRLFVCKFIRPFDGRGLVCQKQTVFRRPATHKKGSMPLFEESTFSVSEIMESEWILRPAFFFLLMATINAPLLVVVVHRSGPAPVGAPSQTKARLNCSLLVPPGLAVEGTRKFRNFLQCVWLWPSYFHRRSRCHVTRTVSPSLAMDVDLLA